MELKSFKILNFKSILDSGWCDLSLDNVTSLIGQNESGKTSVLEALNSFYTGTVLEDYIRATGSNPEVYCSFSITSNELDELFGKENLPPGLRDKIIENQRINIGRKWNDKLESTEVLEEIEIIQIFNSFTQSESEEEVVPETQEEDVVPEAQEGEVVPEAQVEEVVPETQEEDVVPETQEEEVVNFISEEHFVQLILGQIPVFVLFEDFSSLLPNTIDCESIIKKKRKTEGLVGAENFLKIAGIKIGELITSTDRIRDNKVSRSNSQITADFKNFWTQKVSDDDKVKIELVLEHYSEADEEKKGKPYIKFYICDHDEKLFPEQRSKGLKWFLSFYLQLKATDEEQENRGIVFLIDEPGGSLHSRAQKDVLKVFDELKNKVHVIFTTHSPYMLSIKYVHRILAVQRDKGSQSNTHLIPAHELASASSDTLSPLYTVIGADYSTHIEASEKNVILEEISGYYYLTAFQLLENIDLKCSFIPATGTSNVEQLVYMFVGWGIKQIVVFDDESSARTVYNFLKKNLYRDEDDLAMKYLYKIKDCHGIEDLFTRTDFKKFIIGDSNAQIEDKNSGYMKLSKEGKAITALNFMLKVKNEEINYDDFNDTSKNKIKGLLDKIQEMLTNLDSS